MTGERPGRAAGPLGILACAGPLPIEVAEASRRNGRAVHIVAIDGFAADEVTRYPHERVSLGEVGRMIASFRRACVSEIVIAGAMQRPDLLKLKIDRGFVRHLPTVLALTRGGDDSVLRRIVRFFESQGFAVAGVGDVAPDLLAPNGQLGAKAANADEHVALRRGADLIAALAPFDIGQGVVATSNGIVAVEGARGTDAMLRDLGPGGVAAGAAAGAVLVKLAKPGQEMRIDLPTVGAETVRKAAEARLAGIGVGAGGAIVLERARMIADADSAGLFLIGLAAGDADAGRVAADASPVEPPSPLTVAARRAPTPSDRTDIAIGRRLLGVLAEHGAGRACIVAREHVLAVSGRLPLAAWVEAQGRPTSWGRRTFRRRLGVLVIEGRNNLGDDAAADAVLDAPLFRAAMGSGLAGLVFLGLLPDGERRAAIVAWANEAKMFLMTGEAPA
ncbi:MAG: LpxI family protein [Hyphomicrobiaceae bacterium]